MILQKGFTFIELVIVLGIIGILLSVAAPAYKNYTMRATVSEAVGTAERVKVDLVEYISHRGIPGILDFKNYLSSEGTSITTPMNRYITTTIAGVSINQLNGMVTVHVRGQDAGFNVPTSLPVTGYDIAYLPQINGFNLSPTNITGMIMWFCDVPETTMPREYLAVPCNTPYNYVPE